MQNTDILSVADIIRLSLVNTATLMCRMDKWKTASSNKQLSFLQTLTGGYVDPKELDVRMQELIEDKKMEAGAAIQETLIGILRSWYNNNKDKSAAFGLLGDFDASLAWLYVRAIFQSDTIDVTIRSVKDWTVIYKIEYMKYIFVQEVGV